MSWQRSTFNEVNDWAPSCNKDGFRIHHISYGSDCQQYQFSDINFKFLSFYENNAENDTEKGNITESKYEGCNIDIEITGI